MQFPKNPVSKEIMSIHETLNAKIIGSFESNTGIASEA